MLFYLGDVSQAVNLLKQLLEISPTFPNAKDNLKHYEHELHELEYEHTTLVYKQLCRGERLVPTEVTSKLSCRYTNNGDPFLLLAPFKVEEMHDDPKVLVFHDVLYDTEIDAIKELSRPRVSSFGFILR